VFIGKGVLPALRTCLAENVETCGGLYGYYLGQALHIKCLARCRSVQARDDSFCLEIEELFRAVPTCADSRLVGVFHTHPTGSAELSWLDRMALERTYWTWVVAAHRGDSDDIDVRCFARDGRGVRFLGDCEIEDE
jgi:proteasome lid subunit RPN8/RPN11